MSSYTARIEEILQNANSKKVMERRKCVAELLELFDNEEALNTIHRNTKEKSQGIANWSYIMHAVHKLLLNGCDRQVNKDTAVIKAEKLKTRRLMHKTVHYAHSYKDPVLKCNDLMPLIFAILDTRLYEYYHDTYLSILVSYVLPHRTYQVDLNPKQWKELLRICIHLYENESPSTFKRNILEALKMIVDYGSLNSNLLPDVIKILPLLEKVFNDVRTHQELVQSAYQLVNIVCQRIAIESRVVLCKFSEDILLNVISLRSCTEKYKLLLFFIRIHHPKGVSDIRDGAYACNWEKWNTILKSMYFMIVQDSKPVILTKTFVLLASEVFNQILRISDIVFDKKSLEECNLVPPTKRRRISVKLDSPVDMIADINSQEAWPMVQTLIVLLEKYPNCLKSEDFPIFLKIVIELFTQSCKEEDITDDLYQLASALLKNERLFSTIDIENSKMYWDKIWDILLRSLNMNQNEISGHTLAQLFICKNKIIDPNALLRLYLTNVIRWSIMSVRTLIVYIEHLPMPVDMSSMNKNTSSPAMNPDSVKQCLLKWILNIPWPKIGTTIYVDELCSLLIGVTSKTRCEKLLKFDEYNGICHCLENTENSEILSHEYIEQSYLYLGYKTSLFIEKKKKDIRQNIKANDNALHMQNFQADLIDGLFGATNDSEDVSIILMKVTIIAKIASMVKQLNMIAKDDINECLLVSAMKKYLVNAYAILADLDWSKSKYHHLIKITKALNVLYETSYDPDIAKLIVSSPTLVHMLKNIFTLMNIEDSETFGYDKDYYDDYRRKRLYRDNIEERPGCSSCNQGVIRTQVTKALTLFCCIDVGTEKYEIQAKLMKSLLTIDMYDLSRKVDFKMAMIVFEFLMSYCKEDLSKNHREMPLIVLKELHEQCHKDEVAIRYILNILPHFFEYAIKYNYELMNLVNIILECYISISEQKYGFLTHVELIKCLSRLARIEPLNLDLVSKQTVPFMEIILSSLNNPLCIIRLQTVKCIHELYALRYIDFKWKEKLFVEIENALDDLLFIEENLEETKKVDQVENRLATVLLAHTAIICTNGRLQCKALLNMLRLVVDKKIEVNSVEKALLTVEGQISYNNLIEDNLSYLLLHWDNVQHPFPYALLHCESLEEFNKTHINTLVTIKLQKYDIASAKALCDSINVPFEGVVENVFPRILPCFIRYTLENKSPKAIFHKLLSNSDEFAGVKKFSDLFTEKFEETLQYFVQRLHDESYLNELFGVQVSFPKSDPPHFDKQAMDECLKFMEQSLFSQGKSLQHILSQNRPDTLQRMLLNLSSDIYKRPSLEYKLKAFHHYTYFCTLIIQDLSQDCFDSLSMYVIRDIGYSLLHLIKLNDDTLSESACKFFYTFVKSVLPSRSNEMKEILNFTVMTLIPIVREEKMPIASKVLEYLIIDQKEVLRDAIERLNSFPNISVFQEIRGIHNSLKYKTERNYSLTNEMQHFLNRSVDKNIYCSVEDVLHLRLQLSTRKEELRKMYNNLERLRGFAEDCASSMLHQLIYKLIKLTASLDVEVSIEAAKCLGELGPADLTTLMLYLGKSHTRESSDLIEILSYKATTLLTEFLFQNDIELRKASANALYVVLSSYWGQKFLHPTYMEYLKTVLEESNATLRFDYIRPFIVDGQESKNKRININNAKVKSVMDTSNTIWTEKSDGLYSEWIIEATCQIAECFSGFYSKSLIQVCALSTDFCEMILPRMIFLLIHTDKKLINAICSCINKFFDYHFNPPTDANVTLYTVQTATNCDHQIVHCMLNIVNYIRIQITDVNPLMLNYMYIAKAAQYCSAFFTAILYAEMSCENILNDTQNSIGVPRIDYICELKPQQGKIIQNILRDTYMKIGDPDAIYGCGSSHLQDESTRIQHYIHTGNWDKVMLAQDVELSCGNMSVIREMATGLQQSGLQYLLGHFLAILSKSGDNVDEDVLYECAWRLGDWSLCGINQTSNSSIDCSTKSEISEINYHYHHYQALKNFHESNDIGIRNAIKNARMSIVKALRNISLESSKTVYEKLMHLQLIKEIEELSDAKQDEYVDILQKWQQQDTMNSNEFRYIEPILTQRTIMYQIKHDLSSNQSIKHALAATYLEIGKTAANQNNLNIAARSLATLAKQTDLPSKIKDQLLYQEALLAWLRKDLDIGRFQLRTLINKKTLDPGLRAQVLRVYGDWIAETKSENPQNVIKKYYSESITRSDSIKNKTADIIKNLHDTRVALARFADAQFEQISSYMKSQQYECLKECVLYSDKEINASITKDQDLRRAVVISQKQNSNDAAELEHINSEKNKYLLLALKFYLETLQQSEDYNLLIFRVIALWFDNKYHEDINQLLRTNLDKIPSFKFIPLVPQLAAHMSSIDDEFSVKIYKIMERCAKEHPHHTLPVLLALKNLYGDHEYSTDKKNTKRKEEPRVLGARKLLTQLARSGRNVFVSEMDQLSHALVMLANLEIETNKCGSKVNIPRSQEIVKIRNLENVLVPTLIIQVKPSGNYDDVIGVTKYLNVYETVGGVNAPKKMICIGTDGIQRHQLIKGKDDLRQDAVMQQVFNVMNTLLKACKETKRRKLMIRTYKVVPLTQRSGILEWCDNTAPIVSLLMGSNSSPGLQRKYYPKDYTIISCKEKMAKVAKSSNDVKLKAFMDCVAHLRPALHHFFTEKYPSPETWFERRLAFTRSVATTSMVGYILGLGDRHLSNILIDKITAEVIHIDFGIAFEQGKVLPIPETVPFRLTRNIETAMGVSGIEGTMRLCCEKTLAVLRDQRQIIITLLQVLIYDPLFMWAITPEKAHNIQSEATSGSRGIRQGSTGTNKSAERALLRIEQKLQGTEEGLPSSIPGQVERLIQQARDPSNLCRLFCGWQPYL